MKRRADLTFECKVVLVHCPTMPAKAGIWKNAGEYDVLYDMDSRTIKRSIAESGMYTVGTNIVGTKC